MTSSIIVSFLREIEREHGGARMHDFNVNIETHEQRRGQAFMNAIAHTPHAKKLVGTEFDPFYMNYDGGIIRAIDALPGL